MAQDVTVHLQPEVQQLLMRYCKQAKTNLDTLVAGLLKRFVYEYRLHGKAMLFAEGVTVEEYVQMPDEQKDALWSRWQAEAERRATIIIKKVKPGAVTPRQGRRA